MPEYFIMNLLFKTDILRFLNQNIKYLTALKLKLNDVLT